MSDTETNIDKNGRSFRDRAVSFLARNPIVWALPLMTVIMIGGSVIGLKIIKSYSNESLDRPAEVVYVDKTDTEKEAENELKDKRRKFVEDLNQVYPFDLRFSIEGIDGDVLHMTVLREIKKEVFGGMSIFFVRVVKVEAKDLKFKQIRIVGRPSGILTGDTINNTINLD